MSDRHDRMTFSLGPQAAPVTAEKIAEAELIASAYSLVAAGVMLNAEIALQGVGLARKARAEGGASMEVSVSTLDVALADLEVAALAYAEAKGYRRP